MGSLPGDRPHRACHRQLAEAGHPQGPAAQTAVWTGPCAAGGSLQESPGPGTSRFLCGGSSSGCPADCSSGQLVAGSPNLSCSQQNWKQWQLHCFAFPRLVWPDPSATPHGAKTPQSALPPLLAIALNFGLHWVICPCIVKKSKPKR